MRDLLFTSYLFFYNLFIQNLVFRMLALELGNNLLHPLHDLHIPLHDTSTYQGINPQIGVSIIIRTDLGDLDLRMKSRLGGFLLIEYLLIQLLPVSQSREPDLDSLHPAQTDHTLSQIHDPYRFTHIEHEDLSPITHRTGL